MRRAREREARRQSRREARLAKRTAVGAGIAVGAGVIFASGAAQATTTFQVNSLGGAGNGTYNAAECTLREAVTAANSPSHPGTDTVVFKPGLSGTISLYN